MDFRQRTVRDEVTCEGIGLHSGSKVTLTIKPAPIDSGIRFIRMDLPNKPVIKTCLDNLKTSTLSTTIGNNGYKISTIEHLMAAFFGLGIDNARVELNGPEVPIMDGSSLPFIFLLKSVGIKEQKAPKQFVLITKPFMMQDGKRSIQISPAKEIKITFTIEFNHPLIGDQKYELSFSGKDFINEISRARTFGFLKDINMLRENGLALGGSLDNAIVMDEFRVINEDGLRYKDEFVRHKLLDFIGDLAILGRPIIGHFVVNKSGHFLNQNMLKELIMHQECWEMVSFNNPQECAQKSIKIPAFGFPEFVTA